MVKDFAEEDIYEEIRGIKKNPPVAIVGSQLLKHLTNCYETLIELARDPARKEIIR